MGKFQLVGCALDGLLLDGFGIRAVKLSRGKKIAVVVFLMPVIISLWAIYLVYFPPLRTWV